MRVFENITDLSLMIWEVNPRKRNENNIVKFVSEKDHKDGDIIIGLLNEMGNISSYEITEILNKRKSSFEGKFYYEVRTKHLFRSPADFSGFSEIRTVKRALEILNRK